jgi:RHS repeat-associated protein
LLYSARREFAYNLRYPGQYYDAETGLNQNYFRDYDPLVGKYVESDPIGLRAGVNTYAYVDQNPISHIDPLGLDILVCSRKAHGVFALVNANHGYFWDTRNKKSCGAHGSSGKGKTEPMESGPGVDECNLVPGSGGREDGIMKCCAGAGDGFFFPGVTDCQAREKNCIDGAGLNWPGVPGGRFGVPSNTPPAPLPPVPQRFPYVMPFPY